tara:strand:+ start:32 stop:373 length:342 start_codon:yes stop_codon:yes gene_type:complete
MIKKIIKPWGYEEIISLNKKYVLKKLFMKKNHRCSLQYHKKKHETFIVLKGKLKVYLGKKKNKLRFKIFKKYESLVIPPKQIHRMEAITNCTYLEASTPQLKDVVRLSDDYNR